VATYVFAKGAEVFDHQIFDLTSATISGHTLKHLFAALATYCLIWYLRLQANQQTDVPYAPPLRH
jgi:hypothetical protein